MYCESFAPLSTALIPSVPITSSIARKSRRSAPLGMARSGMAMDWAYMGVIIFYKTYVGAMPCACPPMGDHKGAPLLLRELQNRIEQFEQDVLDALFLRSDARQHFGFFI